MEGPTFTDVVQQTGGLGLVRFLVTRHPVALDDVIQCVSGGQAVSKIGSGVVRKALVGVEGCYLPTNLLIRCTIV